MSEVCLRCRIYDVANTTKLGVFPFTLPPGPMSKMLIGAPPIAGKACRIYEAGGIAVVGLYVSWDNLNGPKIYTHVGPISLGSFPIYK